MNTVIKDVAIVGGGPVGLTMAVALRRAIPDLAVALVDRRPVSVPKDQRATALSAGVVRLLSALGVWDRLVAEASPIRRMAITDSGGGDLSRPLFLSFEGDVAPGEPYAHMVPNTIIAEALIAAAEGVAILAPAEVEGFVAEPGSGELALADGRRLRAPLVVAADGQASPLRGMAGIGVIAHDYRQSGVVATIRHQLDHGGTAYEHFRPAGPFASLPLRGGHHSSLVWTESPREAARLQGLAPEALCREIEAAMGSVLGAVEWVDRLQLFPLRLQLARSFIAERVALIGDAAHVIHPIAGQGLNLGLKDVAALAEAVVDAIRLGLDHGAPDVLEAYQRQRRFDTAAMAAATDGLNRLFSNDAAGLRVLRDVGLGLVDRLPPVKQALIRQAAGFTPGRGRLMRGEPL